MSRKLKIEICKRCSKEVLFTTNIESKETQILDAVTPVYKVWSSEGKQECVQTTAYVSHIATCSAAKFSDIERLIREEIEEHRIAGLERFASLLINDGET